MRTIDNVLYRDFRNMMNTRRGMAGGFFSLVDIPLPELSTMINGVPGGKLARVKGIIEPFFERLNGEDVQLAGRMTLKKRQVLSDGTFRRDVAGNYVYMQIPVNKDSVAIVSKVSIGLRRFVVENGIKKEHKVTTGFRYVDFCKGKRGRRYIYIVPKKYVYKLNLCALIMTPNRHRVFYKGCRLALQNGSYIYLYVIPYKYRENMGYRVIGVKPDFNFDFEVMSVIKFWTGIGVIFDLDITALDTIVYGISNLGVMDLEGNCDIEDYVAYSGSLDTEKDDLEFESEF